MDTGRCRAQDGPGQSPVCWSIVRTTGSKYDAVLYRQTERKDGKTDRQTDGQTDR